MSPREIEIGYDLKIPQNRIGTNRCYHTHAIHRVGSKIRESRSQSRFTDYTQSSGPSSQS